MTESFPDAYIVLTGGRGRRLGDADKAMLTLGGQTLLDRALTTTAGRRTVLVGPHRLGRPGITSTIEDPPGGGPAAGVAAGMADLARSPGVGPEFSAYIIGVLAIDQVGVNRDTWRHLAAALSGGDAEGQPAGAVLVAGERRQYGVGVYQSAALAAALATRESWHGISLRVLLDPLIDAEVAASADEAGDIDTPEDLARWRRHEGGAQ